VRHKLTGKISGVVTAIALAVFISSYLVPAAEAKTTPNGQTVGSVLFYVTDSAGEQVLVSQLPVAMLEADMEAGLIDATLHNYSLLDRYTTTVHQEAQGFTIPEFVSYAQSKTTAAGLKSASMTFTGSDVIRLWEIDQTGFDSLDTYTYDDLYGAPRYNFPLLYKYWNYATQDYNDPGGKLTRAQALDAIFAAGEKEPALLSVRAFSQRYIATDSKYGTEDYNMENLWSSSGLLDNERTLRFMKPMTRDDLYNKTPTAADSRYWVANIVLNMKTAPAVKPLGSVAAPTATMTEDDDSYYVRFACETPGATIYYNHNFISPSYTPTHPYNGSAVIIPKASFPSGTVTMTARAVEDGYTDAGVKTLKLASSGQEPSWKNPYADVQSSDWYYGAVRYVSQKGLFDPVSGSRFGPDAPMTRAMLVTALYRLAGSPDVTNTDDFADVPPGAAYAGAVAWAHQTGVVTGTSGSAFTPSGSITREQLAAMLYRYVKATGSYVISNGDMSGFADADSVSAWASDALKWAVGIKLIGGMDDGTLAPQGTASRAQMAMILMQLNSIS
jgi:hypothetical protein